MFVKRMGLMALGSVGITAVLLALMAALVKIREMPEIVESPPITIEIWRVKPKEDVVRKDRLEKPDKVETPPPMPEKVKPSLKVVTNDEVYVPTLPPIKIGPEGNQGEGRHFGATLYISPEYPYTALRKGIEGHVVVQFTVTRFGSVVDPVVVEANPPGYFEKTVLKTIVRYKYNPMIVDGKAVDVTGVREQFTFKIDDKISI